MVRYFTLLVVILTSLILAFMGCSDTVIIAPEQSETPSVVAGAFGAEDGEFQLTFSTAGSAGGPVYGPFVIRGSNIHYDDSINALVVDLTVTNEGNEARPLPVWLTFMSLLP